VSELSRKGGVVEKRHESANAGAARNNIAAEEMMPNHICPVTTTFSAPRSESFSPAVSSALSSDCSGCGARDGEQAPHAHLLVIDFVR
jgi:hypothetical protein